MQGHRSVNRNLTNGHKIAAAYRIKKSHGNYNEDMEPEFFSDNDSFILVLKNINYRIPVGVNKRKVSKRTIDHIEKIEGYLDACSKHLFGVLNVIFKNKGKSRNIDCYNIVIAINCNSLEQLW